MDTYPEAEDDGAWGLTDIPDSDELSEVQSGAVKTSSPPPIFYSREIVTGLDNNSAYDEVYTDESDEGYYSGEMDPMAIDGLIRGTLEYAYAKTVLKRPVRS
ncbi:hypothetical protein L917_10312 [Phytophthora nicotianae]|uniref:Uncharacterized protein n=1 Tax=Phytophthora nicotianae TaxID=4792 RepID=W2L2Q6_PHYNI|nr:hypothetical protein L917_10312 [Phytophthora nicotianae]